MNLGQEVGKRADVLLPFTEHLRWSVFFRELKVIFLDGAALIAAGRQHKIEIASKCGKFVVEDSLVFNDDAGEECFGALLRGGGLDARKAVSDLRMVRDQGIARTDNIRGSFAARKALSHSPKPVLQNSYCQRKRDVLCAVHIQPPIRASFLIDSSFRGHIGDDTSPVSPRPARVRCRDS